VLPHHSAMSIQVGDELPHFEAHVDGKRARVEAGQGGLLLYFMRTADCPLCRAHVKRLIAMHGDLARRGMNVAVVVPSPDSEVQVARSLGATFPVVQSKAGHQQAGLKRVMFDLVQQSGTLVTDSARRVVLVHRATLPANAFPEDAVWALLEAMPQTSTA
jgi:peroxiredoxin